MDLSNYQSFLDRLLVVLVLYKSNLETSESFQSLDTCFKDNNASADIFIYDNSPQQLDPILNHHKSKIHYVWDASNPGVSKAYNEGFHFGEQHGKKWLILLDQDTKFESDFLVKYYQAWLEHPEICLFAPILKLESGEIYSPCKYHFPKTFILKKIDVGVTNLKNLSLLNSGLLISTSIFQKVGKYDERLDLDFTDFEFMDRYRKIQNHFVIVNTLGIHGFSGFQDNLDASFTRFNRYCQSFLILCSIYPGYIEITKLLNVALLRAVKLSLKFNEFKFMATFVRTLAFPVLKNISFSLKSPLRKDR
jgi:rhamnosyltransferase